MLPVSDNEENADQIIEENKEIDHNFKGDVIFTC